MLGLNVSQLSVRLYKRFQSSRALRIMARCTSRHLFFLRRIVLTNHVRYTSTVITGVDFFFFSFQMHNLPHPFKTACEDKHLAGFKKYTKSACLLKCRADYVISMCKCRSYDLEGKSQWHQ